MEIADNILRYYLRNVYFITGTAYAGKSTAAKLLSERNTRSEVCEKLAEHFRLK
ncbi:MAG: hypothetical protein IKP47_09835 [Ruminococcus sp.]|nr:hypothetical protein [Ruminococcus sp.]